MHHPMNCAALVPLSVSLLAGIARGQDAAQVQKETGVVAGLAVHVGSTDGRLETGLAEGGRRIVQGLTFDGAARDAARAAIAAKGLDGLATVYMPLEPKRLPYGDRMVNLLVADLDALGNHAPAAAEIDRVLAPGGAAYLKKGGTWGKTVKGRPPEMDDWGHFDHGPDGNGVSSDRLVRQPLQLQWVSGVQAIKLGGNPAGYNPGAGVRIDGSSLVIDYSLTEAASRRRQGMLSGADAFSGVTTWKRERDAGTAGRRWQLVIENGRVYTYVEKDGPPVALDAATGKTLVTFSAAEGKRLPEDGTQLRVAGDRLLVNQDGGLFCIEAAGGRRLWNRPAEGMALLFPAMDAARKRAYVAVAKADAAPRGRWPWTTVQAVLCLDLENGKELWRNEEVQGKPLGQIIAAGDYVALFCGSAISGRGEGGWVASIDTRTRKLVGEGTFKVAWNDSMYNAVVRDGSIWYAGHTTIYRAPLDSVQIGKAANLGYNQRCNRFAATADLFIGGYVTYWDKTFNGTLQSVARAGCSIGATPANGMVYFTPSACGCFTQLRGYNCLTPEPLPPPIPADRRVQTGGYKPLPQTPAKPPDGPIVDEWLRWGEREARETTEPADAGEGLRVTAVVQRHRVEARDASGAIRWSFPAGGRVSSPPAVVKGTVLFGCHDGWVYALRAGDGALLWRHLAAPSERFIVAYGQLESSWPVYGVAVLDNVVIASAGRHPEIGGGVFATGLDPATGAARWRRALVKPVAVITTTAGKSQGAIVPHSFLNAPPSIEGGRIRIGGFDFTPDETEETLQGRLSTPPPKKKK
jgi:outer membrane protein assembly factor BamB